VNGDGRINSNDITAIGYNTIPEITGGLSAGIGWKGFAISFLLQGATHVSCVFAVETKMPFFDGGNAMKWMFDERWTPETAATATYPRATLLTGHPNYSDNSYFIKDASYLRVKNIQIEYNFKKKILDKIKIKSLRMYCNGLNLFTWDKLKYFDPEVSPGRIQEYPCLKVFNIGVNVGF